MKWVGDKVLGHCVLEKKLWLRLLCLYNAAEQETCHHWMLHQHTDSIFCCLFYRWCRFQGDGRQAPKNLEWMGHYWYPQIFFYFHVCNAIIAISYDWLTSFVFLVLVIFYHASACVILLYTISICLSVCLSIASWYWIIIIKKRTQELHMLR